MFNVPMEMPQNLLPPVKVLLPVNLALKRVTSTSGNGVYASSDTLFRGAVFGRDSIEVGEDVLPFRQQLVRKIILTLARLQGEKHDKITEEEPGRIVHEYRTTVVDGKPIKGIQRSLFEELSSKWGGNDHEMAYYGAVDATPHYIRLVYSYVEQYGPGILSETVTRRSGATNTIKQAVEEAFEWTKRKILASHSGFVEYRRANPHGLPNQVWKDSEEFYVHTNGQMANHNLPIASIEVQAAAYDGLMAATSLLGRDEGRTLAVGIRDKVFDHLWMPDQQYFALGVDYADEAPEKPRIIGTRTANPAALLDSRIFDDIPEQQRQKYVSALVSGIMSYEFLTDAGIRSRALSGAHLVGHWDYHGSFVAWPKETYDIAKGLRRQGFPFLAEQLENRLLNVVWKNREYPEFVYVDGFGRVLATSPAMTQHGEVILVDSTNDPERLQAWTVSAILAISTMRWSERIRLPQLPLRKRREPTWQALLESEVMRAIPRVGVLINPVKLAMKYPTHKYSLTRPKQ